MRRNIFKAIQWLQYDLRAGDTLVFLFSGHENKCCERGGHSMDGVVEFLDLDGEVMFDYELNYELVRPLPLGVKISGAEGLLPWRQYARPAVLGQNEFFSGS